MLMDKRVLVTGAGSGIGREIAVEAARQGAVCVTVADRNSDAVAKTAEVITGLGARAHAVTVDLADSAQVRRMVDEAVAAGGGLDTLVNNAGVLDSAFTDTPTLEELPEEAWDQVYAVNVKAVWLGHQVRGAPPASVRLWTVCRKRGIGRGDDRLRFSGLLVEQGRGYSAHPRHGDRALPHSALQRLLSWFY